MIPLIWAAVAGAGAVAYGIKKVYDMGNSSSGSSGSSSRSSDNSAELAAAARKAEERAQEASRKQRERKLIRERMVDMVNDIQTDFLSTPSVPSTLNSEQIQRFVDFDIQEPAAAKAALAQLLNQRVQLRTATPELDAVAKEHQALQALEQQVARL